MSERFEIGIVQGGLVKSGQVFIMQTGELAVNSRAIRENDQRHRQ